MSKIKPVYNKIVVKEIKEEKSPGGIIMPVIQDNKFTAYGVVLAAGPGRVSESGQVLPVCVKEGDKVTISLNVTTTMKVDGGEVWIVPDSEVICIHEGA
jgi:chaperonin GroES